MHIGNLAGIPIRIHWSFWGLIAYALWAQPSGMAVTLLGLTGLFGSVVLHELGHALAARRFGIPTAHITLYPFGGIAALHSMPTKPSHELVIALAGPLVNAVLAVGFGLLYVIMGSPILGALTAMNLILGLFNLVPAFPMDGGRVLRASLAFFMGWTRASVAAIRVGGVFAVLFLLIGVVTFDVNLLMIGGFLLLALRGEQARLDRLMSRRNAQDSSDVVFGRSRYQP
jgi:Zn-dependent protease